MPVFITTFNVKQLFEDFKKILKIIDKSKLKDKQKDLIHSLLDLNHPRYMYHKNDISWKDMLLNFKEIIPNVAKPEEIEAYQKFLEGLVLEKHEEDHKTDIPKYTQKVFYEIKQVNIRQCPRFVIVKYGTDEILDDAQGFGYSTKTKAIKAAWYMFRGGRETIKEAKMWWRRNKNLVNKVALFINKKDLENFDNSKSKDFTRTVKYIRKKCEKMEISGFKESYLKVLRQLM